MKVLAIPEGFKPIPNFENYLINTTGDIISLKTKRRSYAKYIKTPLDRYGYKKATLYKNGKYTFTTVHRLVAKTFIPNPENKETVNHINGVRTDNRVENLEWCTIKENNYHSHKLGNQVYQKQKIKSLNLFTGQEKIYESHREASRDLKIRQSTISRSLKRNGIFKNYKFEVIE